MRPLFTYWPIRTGVCVTLVSLALGAGIAHGQDAAQSGATQRFNDLLNNNCAKCHNSTDWAGGLAFDTLDLSQAGEDPQVWEKAITKLTGRLMPPAGQKQPSQADVDAFVGFLETALDSSAKDRGVGHVPLERLSRTEFAASVQGLLGVDVDPKQI